MENLLGICVPAMGWYSMATRICWTLYGAVPAG